MFKVKNYISNILKYIYYTVLDSSRHIFVLSYLKKGFVLKRFNLECD